MEQTQLTSILYTIEQAIETLKDFYAEWLPLIKAMSQEELKAVSHSNASKLIRDSWYLCWYEGNPYEHQPKEKPNW